VGVGARKAGDPFTVLIASGVKPAGTGVDRASPRAGGLREKASRQR
jgi:hypothetical protein